MIGLSILLAVVAYIWLARVVARRIQNRTAKYLVIALFVLIPTWDVIVSRFYFYTLCSTEGGQKIYKAVEIGKEYYGPDVKNAKLTDGAQWEVGKAYTIHVEGDHPSVKRTVRFVPDTEKLKSLYEISIAKFSDEKVLNVQKISSVVKDKQTGKILGTATSFNYWGGWIYRNSGLHVGAVECPETKVEPYVPSIHATLLENVFRPAKLSLGH